MKVYAPSLAAKPIFDDRFWMTPVVLAVAGIAAALSGFLLFH